LEVHNMATQPQATLATQKRLTGKVALVTGGSRGIGAAIALRLAQEGATVAITYNQSEGAANEVIEKIHQAGAKGSAFKANASSAEENQRLIESIVSHFGKIDILVNNAGVLEIGRVDEIDLDQYARIFDVNVKGVIATTIAALPQIREGGRIINI